MKEKKSVGPHKLLKVCGVLFYGGLGLTAVVYLIGASYQWRGNDVPTALWFAAGAGILGMVGGLLTAFLELRCPYCGVSLMLGGRMPSSLPRFCPGCGKPLDGCD